MTYLNRIFGSVEDIAKNEVMDDNTILGKWEDYLETIPEKKRIIEKLSRLFDKRKASLRRLKKLLTLEIVDVQVTKKDEDDMISNLESLEHSRRMKRIERLRLCFDSVETEDKYVYNLLCHIYVILRSEWRLVEKLENNEDIRKYRKWVGLLRSELAMERSVLNQMYYDNHDVPVFHDIFTALVRREKVMESMDDKEKKLLRTMQKRMDKISSGKISTGITLEWGRAVFHATKIKVQEAYDRGILSGDYGADFQFVNRPEFIDLVREVISKIRNKREREGYKGDPLLFFPRNKDVSERMIKVFVHVFREWFNELD
ncbi:hypothetical protein KY366_02545 [Candidatus Woesearchaeota archaeon]|nr:hypothetical protein [Candidatus Woesearchaeota archaeon]